MIAESLREESRIVRQVDDLTLHFRLPPRVFAALVAGVRDSVRHAARDGVEFHGVEVRRSEDAVEVKLLAAGQFDLFLLPAA